MSVHSQLKRAVKNTTYFFRKCLQMRRILTFKSAKVGEKLDDFFQMPCSPKIGWKKQPQKPSLFCPQNRGSAVCIYVRKKYFFTASIIQVFIPVCLSGCWNIVRLCICGQFAPGRIIADRPTTADGHPAAAQGRRLGGWGEEGAPEEGRRAPEGDLLRRGG